MAHSDDVGLVLPPRVAPIQIVVVPMVKKSDAMSHSSVLDKAKETSDKLIARGYRVHLDDRYSVKPGNRFFEWDRKGVPLRIEIGQKEVQENAICIKARNRKERSFIKAGSDYNLVDGVAACLDSFHSELYERANLCAERYRWRPNSYEEVLEEVRKGDMEGNENSSFGYIEAPWCASVENEVRLKEETKLTLRCYPFDKQQEAYGKKCFLSKKPATHIAIFAKAY
eukprot:gb/GECG01015162.1/.p1 GENE.gb/GECG01015162.1/~~gb/GECG01015162.1/.p1  ORF type:complete len:226 (+),score=29.88 gb/GECG01015162.1/:1-678(+)